MFGVRTGGVWPAAARMAGYALALEKLVNRETGTIIVVCGYAHFESLVEKLRARGHAVDKRVYLDTVPTIRSREIVGASGAPIE